MHSDYGYSISFGTMNDCAKQVISSILNDTNLPICNVLDANQFIRDFYNTIIDLSSSGNNVYIKSLSKSN